MASDLDVVRREGIYLRQLGGQIRASLDPSDLPDEATDLLFDIYAVLALAVGEGVTAADVHNAWVTWMLRTDPGHPSLVPFEELDAETAASDEPFAEAIRHVARMLAVRGELGANG